MIQLIVFEAIPFLKQSSTLIAGKFYLEFVLSLMLTIFFNDKTIRIHTTYTLPKSYYKKVGIEVPYPGVDWEADQNEFRYHRYYQWVGFVLFFQSTLFYIPRWLWKMWEGGKIQALMMDLDVGVCSDHEKKQKKKLLVDYLYSSRGHHNWYAGRYFFCELLSLANVLFQIYALDRFFEGEFLTYGIQVIEFSQMDQG